MMKKDAGGLQIRKTFPPFYPAVLAQLGERQTEDLKVSGSIPEDGKRFVFLFAYLSKVHVVKNANHT